MLIWWGNFIIYKFHLKVLPVKRSHEDQWRCWSTDALKYIALSQHSPSFILPLLHQLIIYCYLPICYQRHISHSWFSSLSRRGLKSKVPWLHAHRTHMHSRQCLWSRQWLKHHIVVLQGLPSFLQTRLGSEWWLLVTEYPDTHSWWSPKCSLK